VRKGVALVVCRYDDDRPHARSLRARCGQFLNAAPPAGRELALQ
jgi:hypothetical protein